MSGLATSPSPDRWVCHEGVVDCADRVQVYVLWAAIGVHAVLVILLLVMMMIFRLPERASEGEEIL